VIHFSVEIISVKHNHIVAVAPESLYKNLDRSFSRINIPEDLQVQFIFLGDRYSLPYHKVSEYESGDIGEGMPKVDPKNLTAITAHLAAWSNGRASGYTFVLFKDAEPASPEERIVSETGKTLFLPSTREHFPKTDPYPQKRLITEDLFRRYVESTGVNLASMDETVNRFIKGKNDQGILSDAWVPVFFQEYVIGYIHIWIDKEGKPPFDNNVIDTLYQYAKLLAFALKENGRFDSARIRNEPFAGKILDISAAGLLFGYPNSALSSALLLDCELAVKLTVPKRTIKANAKIVRHYKDHAQGYFGCRFLDMAPEDMRFLFEYIYGKPFTNADASFIVGQV
jgi:hypothetical protein